MEKKNKLKRWSRRGVLLALATFYLVNHPNETIIQANDSRSSHIGTFEGETTFSLSSETGILPSIEIETKDVYGNTYQYQSEGGSLVIPSTKNRTMIKSVILKGQALVNIVQKHDAFNVKYPISSGNYDLKWLPLQQKLRPNTTYIFIYNYVSSNVLNGPPFASVVLGRNTEGGDAWACRIGWHEKTNFAHPIEELGLNSIVFTTSGYVGNLNSIGFVAEIKEIDATIKDVMIIEYQDGIENWNIPYFEGTQSVKAPVLTISNEDGSETAEITIEENLVLRSNGTIYDELDLMTGKFTQRLDENNEVLDQEMVRYVKINSTHTFDSIQEADISVKGTITPTLVSVAVPTEGLTFTLNPNLESDQQFIAPDFSISNESRAPIGVELKSFEQMTNVLNDVLPSKYASWEGLNKKQSEDIALALIPQASDRWISLNEGAYYVANTVNQTLGTIKGNSVVDFKFSALHGQAFSEPLTPQYKLTFVFEL